MARLKKKKSFFYRIAGKVIVFFRMPIMLPDMGDDAVESIFEF